MGERDEDESVEMEGVLGGMDISDMVASRHDNHSEEQSAKGE